MSHPAPFLAGEPAPVTVVKLGGRPQGDPALPAALARAWEATGRRLVVVHGGGDAISELQRARGLTPQFVGGRRVTTPADLEIIRMALSGLANKQVVAAMRAAGVPALGLSGEDGGLLLARPTADAAMGAVGEPACVDARLLLTLLDAGYCPVVSPVSASTDAPGQALNVNGDDAAAAVAAALVRAAGGAELFFLADVPGVLDGGLAVPTLDPGAARALVAQGIAAGGMAAKLEAGIAAVSAGVAHVRIGDVAALVDDPAHPSRGTTLVAGSAGSAGLAGTAAVSSASGAAPAAV